MQYGMGTYIRELTYALLAYTDIKLYIVAYNSIECKEFSVQNVSPRLFNICIPPPKQSPPHTNQSENRYATAVVNLLSEIIPRDGEVAFQMNYIDDLPIIRKINERYQYPVITMVHFAQWQQLFEGNRHKLEGLNIDVPTNNIEFTLSKEKEMFRLSDHIISVTRYMKDFLIEEYGTVPEKIDVVPNGIDNCKIHSVSEAGKLMIKKDLGFYSNEKVILFSGRIDQCKGVFFLIDAFIEACKHKDNLRLVIIGQGDVQQCLNRYDLFYGKITFTGFLPKTRVLEFYQVADIGIIPSVYDHCPYTVLEMMAHKIPLILSRIDGLNEMLDDSQCLFIDPVSEVNGEISFDKMKLVEAILLLIDDKEKANDITKDYPELISTRFSGERMAREMYSIYKSISEVTIAS